MGTCLEYGDKNGAIKERDSCKPNTEYGKGKLKLLKKLKNLKNNKKFNLTWLRLFYIYSEKPKKKTLLSDLSKKIKKINFLLLINLMNIEISLT